MVCLAWITYTLLGMYVKTIPVTDMQGIYLPLAIAALRHGLSTELFKAIVKVLSQQQAPIQPTPPQELTPTSSTAKNVPVDVVLDAVKQALMDQQQ